MKKVYIDFESRSQIDIWDSGAYRYTEDSSTEILCLAWAIDNGPVQGVLRGKALQAAISELNALVQEGAEFHAHNAYFERCMWHFKLVPLYGALPIPIKQWRCTAAKAGAHALPRQLEKAALALGIQHQKDMEGHRVMLSVCKTTGAIAQEKLERLLLYCKRDVEAERDLDCRLADLHPYEQRVWYMDQYLNDSGVRIDTLTVKNAIQIIEREKVVLNKELFDLTGGQVNAGTQRDAIKRYLESKGVALPDLTKNTVKKALENTKGDNFRVLQLRQQLSLTSNAKYAAFANAVSKDERIRDLLVYHGAATGRWSGKLVQIQNLVKSSLSSREVDAAIGVLRSDPEAFVGIYEPLTTLSSCLRGMFIPSEKQEMYITDFSAIEARVVMWLADEQTGLKLFDAQDSNPELPDIYVHMARSIHGKALLTKADKKERQLGKQAVLGCGYGMGVKKFIETCNNYHVEVTDQLAKRAVKQYRTVFKKVPKFWDDLERTAKEAVSSKTEHRCGKLTFFMDGEFLRMRLPSGRTIVYHKPKIDAEGKLTYMTVNSLTHKYERDTTWGGCLVENATQAVARDIMVEAMFRLLKANYKILFTVHDELVLEKEKEKGSEQEIIKIVRELPVWAVGCPINAECEKVRRYKK